MNKRTQRNSTATAMMLMLFLIRFANAQDLDSMTKEERQVYMEKIKQESAADHQKMMATLHITTLRPGADGMNKTALNAVNYDEAKANPYPNLPDPLTLKNENLVTTAAMWWNERRPEIVGDFDKEVYGRVPANTPKISWSVASRVEENMNGIPVITRKLVGHVDNSGYRAVNVDIQVSVTTPAKAAKPVPLMMEFTFIFPSWFNLPRDPDPNWKQQLINKGWGFAIIIPSSIQDDNGAGLTKGIIGLINKGQRRKPDDWGALRAWAWGASRILDYLETDKTIDAKKVGIEGHSRYGKAAEVTMAYDQRFSIAYISSSGEGGAKLHRRNAGEIVENLTGSGEYHWMAGNFIKYGGPLNPGDLPVDSHELLALCAPRPVFIGAGDKGDEWTDQKGMFMAEVAAGPVYKLLGKKDLGTDVMPPLDVTIASGDLAWRQHHEGHTSAPNWPAFIEFASKYW